MVKQIKIAIGRAKDGCSLNGREYLLNNNGDVKTFKSESVAKAYLRRMGLSEDEIESLEFIQYV